MTGFHRVLLLTLVLPVGAAHAAGLAGSPASMRRQNEIARENHLAFARSTADVRASVDSGALVAVRPSRDVVLADVSQPYARAEIALFVERLGAQYRAAMGSPLVVTSLTRPAGAQPRNAHALSVHPAGMAVDLRVPASSTQRAWLEETLLSLEGAGVLDVTRERRPPHYHVAVYPAAYAAYVARLDSAKAVAVARADSVVKEAPAPAEPAPATPTGTNVAMPVFGTLGGLALASAGLLWGRRRRAAA